MSRPEVARLSGANVRFGSKADIGEGASDVRFTPKSGHWNAVVECPLCAITGSRKRSLQIAREHFQDLQRMIRSLRFSLFKVLAGETHCIGDLCQAEDCRVSLLGKCVKGRRLHFDGEYAFRTCCFNCFGRLPKGCIRRPTRTDMGADSCLV